MSWLCVHQGPRKSKQRKKSLTRGSPSRNVPATLDLIHHQSLGPLNGRQGTSPRSSSSERVPALQRVVFLNGVQWHRPFSSSPFSRSSSCLLFDDLFVKKIDRDVPPPPPPRKFVPLMQPRFMKGVQCFDLKYTGGTDSLFFKPISRKQSSSIQFCCERIEVDVHGAGKCALM